ncbi:MAG: endoglucanase, partial [Thermoproteota archaeon]
MGESMRGRKIVILPVLLSLILVSLTLIFQPVYASIITLEWPKESWPSAMVDVNGDGKVDYNIEVCPWNINSASGSIKMTFDTDTRVLATECSLTNVQPLNYVNGYPEIYVGRKPWGTTYANGLGVNFPISVSTLMSSSLYVSYSISVNSLLSSMNFNIAADAWIVRPDVANNPGTAPGSGDVELMVWVFRQNLGPAGSKVGEVTVGNRVWEVYRENSVSWGGWQYIAFIPKDWSISSGTVSYDIAQFVRLAKQYATFDISQHYLLGWELGTEWGTASSGGTAQFSWTMSGLQFTLTPTPTPTPTP